MDDPIEVRDNHLCVLAILAMIGGVDNRPRLGGHVTHEDWGAGTISKITNNGKVILQCHDLDGSRVCKLTELTVVSAKLFSLQTDLLLFVLYVQPMGAHQL